MSNKMALDARNELVTAIHTLASHFENTLYTLRDDAKAKAKGDIAHALKVAAKHNYNGSGCRAIFTQPADETPAPGGGMQLAMALNRMDSLLDPSLNLLAVSENSITLQGCRADMLTIRRALRMAPAAREGWQPIETAPKDWILLLGYFNESGKWRTVRGEWFCQEEIDDQWEFPENGRPGWYETCVNADDPPNCWPIEPTHWMPLPTPPKD